MTREEFEAAFGRAVLATLRAGCDISFWHDGTFGDDLRVDTSMQGLDGGYQFSRIILSQENVDARSDAYKHLLRCIAQARVLVPDVVKANHGGPKFSRVDFPW